MAKHFSEKQKNLFPSQRKYAEHMKVSAGCVDVWRINIVQHGRVSIHSQWRDRAKCMERADELHKRTLLYYMDRQNLQLVYVEHKAAIEIDGKFHIVNIPTFKFADELTPDRQHDSVRHAFPDPDPDHKQWLAEFEGMPVPRDTGEAIHFELDYHDGFETTMKEK